MLDITLILKRKIVLQSCDAVLNGWLVWEYTFAKRLH